MPNLLKRHFNLFLLLLALIVLSESKFDSSANFEHIAGSSAMEFELKEGDQLEIETTLSTKASFTLHLLKLNEHDHNLLAKVVDVHHAQNALSLIKNYKIM